MNNSITKLKASAKTTPKNLAWAIVSALSTNSEKVEITAVGAAATNQVVKALAIARGLAITKNKDVISKACINKKKEGVFSSKNPKNASKK